MKYKKIMIMLIMAIFLVSIGSASAADANDTAITSEDTNQIELSSNIEITEDNLQTNDDETLSAETGLEILSAGEGNYSDLRTDIENGGSLTKSYYSYHDGDGQTIEITTPDMIINGNGAIIDMAGSTIQAFTVNTAGVTIKNLTIKNANYNGEGGAIYFTSSATSGTVENCNFINNSANYYGGAVYFYSNGEVTNCNFINNNATLFDGGAIYFYDNGNVTNCNFTNNKATCDGGAIRFSGTGTVTNCNFTNNAASDWGGAIYMNSGTVTNCNFTNNTAKYGGAIYFLDTGEVTNCNFTNNQATGEYSQGGGAIMFVDTGTVTNCNFINNTASTDGGAIWMSSGTVTNSKFINNVGGHSGAILSENWWTVTADTCIFKTNSDSTYQVHILPPTLNVDNFTTIYNSGAKLTFNLTTNNGMPVGNGNISISVYYKEDGILVNNYSCLSGEGWAVDLPVGFYYAVFNTEYAGFKPVTRAITVNKIKTEIDASAVTTTYNINKNLVITLKDSNGNILSGVKVTVDLNGAKTYTTDNNGQVKVATNGLAAKSYTAKITFNGDTNYEKSNKDVKVTVKKATPKITAKKKTFKRKVKTKKYTITLKNNIGKAIKKAKVTIKIKKKTYKATTNAKGKAVFKIKKLTRKGTFKATIKFKGNSYYKAATKKVKIKIK